MVYRGIENLWGSVWQFVDGLNIKDYQAWVCSNPASYASNVFAAPYEQLSYINHNADGYVTALGRDPAHPGVSLPVAVGGGTATYFGDYYYRSTGQRIAVCGGGWSDGSIAGLAHWYLHNSSSHTRIAIGGRLLKTPL
jgi:hypothetical protein